MIITTTLINSKEFTLDITNFSNNVLVDVHLTSKNLDDMSKLVDSLTIYRERGHLFYPELSPNLQIGNLYPEETAKLAFKLKKSLSQEEVQHKIQQNIKLQCDTNIDDTSTYL